MRELPTAQLEMLHDPLGDDLLGKVVAGEPPLDEITQRAARQGSQRHAEVEQDVISFGHGPMVAA